MKPKTFTIVTPSFNQGQYIEQTIQSVLSQEGDFSIDYIIADGGSTDATVEIIQKYDELLKKGIYPIKCRGIELRWWSRKDSGQSDAINQGFRLAKGHVVAWINSDDFYEPGAFQKAFDIFDTKPNTDLVYGSGYFLREETGIKTFHEINPTDFKHLLFTGCNIFQPSTFMKHSTVKKLGYLDENLRYVMDYDLWLKMFMNNGNAVVEKMGLATFRFQTESKTVSQADEFPKEIHTLMKRYGGHVIDKATINRILLKIKHLETLKKKCPKFFFFVKTLVYSISDKFKYKNPLKEL